MVRRVCVALAAGLSLLIHSCGGGGGSESRVDYVVDHTGIVSITLDNREITRGALYIIGACNTIDDPRTNVTSYLAPDGILVSPRGVCPGAPFSITNEREGAALLLTLTVGPLPVSYSFLSVPMQFPLVASDTFRASTGREGTFGSIPPVNAPGEVQVRGAVWGEVAGDGFIVRRSCFQEHYEAFSFIRNPLVGVETLEPRWLALPEGATFQVHERIEVLPR